MPNQWAINHCIYAQQLVRYRIFVRSTQLISYISWVIREYIVLVKDRKSHTQKVIGSGFRESLVTWPELQVTREN